VFDESTGEEDVVARLGVWGIPDLADIDSVRDDRDLVS